MLVKEGILGKLRRTRCAVPLVTPVFSQTSRQLTPCARRVAILVASTTTRGRPSRGGDYALSLRLADGAIPRNGFTSPV
jgi:hypothetical protein